MGKFNDLELENWRELDIDIDSLWLIGERAKTGKHKTSTTELHPTDSKSTLATL